MKQKQLEEVVLVCTLHLLEQLESEGTCATAQGVVLSSIMELERNPALVVLSLFVYSTDLKTRDPMIFHAIILTNWTKMTNHFRWTTHEANLNLWIRFTMKVM